MTAKSTPLRSRKKTRQTVKSDAEQMAGHIEVGHLIDVRLQRLSIDLVKVGNEIDEGRPALIRILAHAVQFRAVTRREDHGLADGGSLGERTQRHLQPARLKVDPLTQFDRRSAVADSNKYEMHGPLRDRRDGA